MPFNRLFEIDGHQNLPRMDFCQVAVYNKICARGIGMV